MLFQVLLFFFHIKYSRKELNHILIVLMSVTRIYEISMLLT